MSPSNSELSVPEAITLDIDDIIPYWRNPRRMSSETVNAIAESISRYGYQQPIVVDEDYVIIIGHTRYTALRRLNVTSIPVLVAKGLDADKVKQLRIIDNKAAEFTMWDFEKLQTELGKMDQDTMQAFFYDIAGMVDPEGTSENSFDANAPLPGQTEDEREADADNLDVEFICPDCFHSFTKHVTRNSIMTGVLK
jgi:hypothetical protein